MNNSMGQPTVGRPTVKFSEALRQEPRFHLRRAVERLREGLFDPIAVRLLTAHEHRLSQIIEQSFQQLEQGNPTQLCVCGSYGQGKSHSLTYIQEQALQANYVTSMVNLDLREVPLHHFRQVYRALMANLKFPNSETSFGTLWKEWTQQVQKTSPNGIVDVIPETVPHLFKAILVGMAQKTITLTPQQKTFKKHAQFRPREFSYLLEKALLGESIPVNRLRNALKYRQVSFYREGSLASKDNQIYLEALQGLGSLFRKMGYQGWVLLFDEGEAIAQVPVTSRGLSYQILQQLFSPKPSTGSVFPIFAFTEDFFQQVESEDYERVRIRNDQEIPYFLENYSETWQDLSRYDLQDLTQQEWDELAHKLITLYAQAYQWQPKWEQAYSQMCNRLSQLSEEETRYKLKALVEQLDLLHQEH